MRRIILIFLAIYSATTLSQEPFASFDHNLGPRGKKATQLFSAVFPETDQVLIFVEDKKSIAVYPYDTHGLKTHDGFSFPNFAKKYANIGGYTVQDNKYTLFLSNRIKNKWAILTLDLESQQHDLQEVRLDIDSKKILEAFTHNNKLYVFSVKINSSIIEAHVLSTNGEVRNESYTFDDIDFGIKRSFGLKLDEYMGKSNVQAAIIDTDSPAALESTKERTKFYQNGSQITLTLDDSKKETFILQFDLDNGSSSSRSVDKTVLNNAGLGGRSNSFIFDDKLFVFKASSQEMNFTIYELDSKKIIKSFSAEKDTPITFKNTPIIQEGGEFNSYRELEKTSKFLRKVSQSNPAIAVFKQDGKYVITLGATKEVTQGGPMVFMYGGGLAGIAITGLVTGITNATFYQYASYSYTKSARFQMVLDESFNVISDIEVPQNSFDDIKSYTYETPDDVIQTVFKLPEFFVWGALNAKNNRINFFKF